MKLTVSIIDKKYSIKKPMRAITYPHWKIETDDLQCIIYFLNGFVNKLPQDGWIIEININEFSKTWFYTVREFWYWVMGFDKCYQLYQKDNTKIISVACYFCKNKHHNHYECEKCGYNFGEIIRIDSEHKFKFCPSCGREIK